MFGFEDPVKNMQNLLAYIDPASGTLLLQALIAAGIGGIAFFRRSIWGFLTLFTRRRSAESSSDASPSAANPSAANRSDGEVADPPA